MFPRVILSSLKETYLPEDRERASRQVYGAPGQVTDIALQEGEQKHRVKKLKKQGQR
jgi:hypothetical protein